MQAIPNLRLYNTVYLYREPLEGGAYLLASKVGGIISAAVVGVRKQLTFDVPDTVGKREFDAKVKELRSKV